MRKHNRTASELSIPVSYTVRHTLLTGPSRLPTADDIRHAARRIGDVAHRTPIVTSRSVDARVGARVFFKCENLQRAGAFKFRGAYNAISRLPPDARARGIVTYSSGNHAQAIALAGQLLNVPRTIVMPTTAPAVKKAATAGYGGHIIEYDPERESREALAEGIARDRGLTLIPPFDHPDVIAGQGTAALELIEQVGELDALVVPCGGGGLLSGCALISRALMPDCRVIGVEPAAGDDATRSFRTRTLQTVRNPRTVADGARTASLGVLTFPLVLSNVADMVTVDDRTLLRTMFYLWERLKTLVEPTGALGAAALFEGPEGRTNSEDSARFAGFGAQGAGLGAQGGGLAAQGARRIGVILSGGNVDLADVAAWHALVSTNQD